MKMLEKSEAGFKQLSMVLYVSVIALTLLSLIPFLSIVTIFMSVIVLILAFIRIEDSKNTLYHSHIRNFIVVNVVGIVILFFGFLFTIITLGIGGIFLYPVSIVYLIWALYKIIKGIVRLNDNNPY